MLLIKETPESNGAYRNLIGNFKAVPAGWRAVPAELEETAVSLLPFLTLTLDDEGNITEIRDNPEAGAAQETPPEEQIEALKLQLDKTDYRIIKSYEYSLAGLEPPYDIEALHTERMAIRDLINALENK